MKEKCKTNKDREEQGRGWGGGRGRSYSKRVITKRFCCAFQLGFPQLICKASLTFK